MHWGIVLSLENIGNISIKHTIKINIIYCFDSSSNWMKSNGRGEMRHTYLSNAQGSCLLNSLLKSCLYQRTTRKESFLFLFLKFISSEDGLNDGDNSYSFCAEKPPVMKETCGMTFCQSYICYYFKMLFFGDFS